MATTQLTDLYDPKPFEDGINQVAQENNAFLSSGVLVPDQRLTSMATAGGMVGEMPYLNDLDRNDPNLTNDDPAINAVPDKLGSGKTNYRLAKLHRSWSVMDFAAEVGRPKGVMNYAISRIGAYWAAVQEKRLIQSSVGVLADNIANDAGDMVNVSGATITEMAIEVAAQTMGDQKQGLAVLAIHSAVETQLRGLQVLRDHHDPKTGNLIMTTYNGRRVVVDDQLPVTGGVYTSVLFAAGAFRLGSGMAQVPSELERDAKSGNGGGQSIVHSRRNDIIQPVGMSFTSATVADESATPAELALAGNWNREYDRKAIGMAFLTSTS